MPQEFIPDAAVFQAAVANSYDIINLLREDGTILYVSPSITRILGYEPAELVGRNAFDLVHPEDRPRIQSELEQALAAGSGEVSAYRWQTRDGQWRWLRSTGSLIDCDQQPRTIVVNSRDITEHFESRHALLKANEEMRAVWESMTDAFYALDNEWRFLHINRAGEQLLHRQREELVGRVVWEEFPETLQVSIHEQYLKAKRDRVSVTFEQFYPPLETWFEIHAYPSGSGLAVYFRDISERKLAEEEQRQARRFLQSTIDALSASVAVLDEAGNILTVNAAWRRLAQFSEAVGVIYSIDVGANYLDICDQATGEWALEAPRVARAVRDIIAGERQEYSVECPYHVEGEKYWFLLRITRFDDAVPGRIVVSFEDVSELFRAREEVRYSQQLHQTLIDNIPNGGVYLLDRDMTILLAGGRGIEVLGIDVASIIGKNGAQVYGREPAFPELSAAFHRVLGGEAVSIEVEIRSRWRLVQGVPLRDENGAIIGVMAMTQDITDRRQTEEALRTSEVRLTRAQSIAHVGYLELDVHNDHRIWSDETYRILGLEPPDSDGFNPSYETLLERVPPEDKPRVEQIAAQMAREAKPFEIEHRIVRPNGELRWVQVRCEVTADEDGGPAHFAGTMLDITERKQAEETRARLAAIVESSQDAIFSMDREGAILTWNQAAEQMYGYSIGDIVGQSVYTLVPDGEVSLLREKLTKGEAVENFESQRQRPDGTTVDVSLTLSPLVDDRGQSLGGSIILRDITKSKQAEEALQHSQRLYQTLAHNFPNGSVFLLDRESHILLGAGRGLALLGLSTDMVLGKTPRDIFGETDLSDRLDAAHRAALEGQESAFEVAYEDQFRMVRFVPIDEGSGEINQVLAMTQDITAAKRAEETHARLAAIVQSSDDAIIGKDLNGKITNWNPGAERIYGYTAEEVIGKSINLIVPPERLHEEEELLEKHQRGEHVGHFETERIHKNGRRITVSLASSPLYDNGGRVIGASKISRDITAQKEAEAERERFFSLSLDMLCIFDENGIFLRVNPAFQIILGYKMEDLLGSSFLDYLHPDDRASSEAGIAKLKEGIPVTNYVNRYRCRDGSYRSILWLTTPYGEKFYGAGRDITAIQATQHELQHSLTLLEATLESAADGILVVDVQGRMTHYNKRFLDIWGLTDDHIIFGDNSRVLEVARAQVVNPDTFQDETRAILSSPSGEGSDVVRFKDGRIVERHSRALRLNNQSAGRVWSFSDITQRMRDLQEQADLNRQIDHQRRRLNDILTNVPGIVWENTINSETGRQDIVYVSPYLEKLLGYTPEEWLGTASGWFGALHPDDRERAIAESVAILRSGQSGTIRYRMLTKDGRELWTETNCVVTRDEQGQPVGLLGVTMDITERMHAIEEQSRLLALLESTSDFVGWTDTRGLAKYINPAGRAMLGFSPDEPIVGREITEFAPEWAGRILVNVALPEASRHGSWSGEAAILRRDGREIPVSQVVTAHKDATGHDLFYSTIARDISESKRVQTLLEQANEQLEERVAERTGQLERANIELRGEILERQMAVGALREVVGLLEQAREEANQARDKAEGARLEAEQANQAKSEFLSRMSHELRTPMNAILGFGQILEMRPLGARESESVQQILKAGQHLLQLINEILEISRIEAGKLSISIEPVPLEEVVFEVFDLMRPIATRRGIALSIDNNPPALPPAPVFLNADRQRLRQVLLNLVSNAVKYNRDSGTVTVRLLPGETPTVLDGDAQTEGGPYIRIEVQDTGKGIAPEDRHRLFVPFERLGAEGTAVEGTGIGLSLAKRLTELMHGRIGLDSTLGEGSRFWIDLPLASDPVLQLQNIPEEQQQAPLLQLPRDITVLYIEDNASNLSLLETVLEEVPQIKMLSAIQGRLGLDLARQHLPDMVLLDLHLPDIMGDEVLRELRSDPRTADIPVVMLSADATEKQIQKLLQEGAREYLTKPLNIKQLLEVIHATVA